jgi:long-chain acyl-CoA synthetase
VTLAEPSTVDQGVTGARSLPARLLEHARDRAGEVAVREKYRGCWREWTWAEYAARVAAVAAGLRSLGVGAGSRVAVHAENRPEWVIADLAVQGLGACGIGCTRPRRRPRCPTCSPTPRPRC